METFTDLTIEAPGREIRVDLKDPMTIDELWAYCRRHRNRPLPILSLSKGKARVTYNQIDRRANP